MINGTSASWFASGMMSPNRIWDGLSSKIGISYFIDSEPETWNICPNALEDAIKDRILNGKKPKAIIAVHLYGMPFKVDEIKALSIKYEIPILEDSAEALGSHYKGQKCGTFGDIGVLSFNGNKIITTSGSLSTKTGVAP